MNQTDRSKVDVLIVGAGLAGLSLARHLILQTDFSIMLIEKRAVVPPLKQKVGESLVQVGGYYFAKVLDMEEHLLHEHFMKYNLRFYFKTDSDNVRFEDYSQSYIRNFSNIPCYQLDRLTFERALLAENLKSDRFTIVTGASHVSPTINPDGLHETRFELNKDSHLVRSNWIVDTTGRARLLQRKRNLQEESDIKHGASFMWVDGLINIEKLTDRSTADQRRNPNKRQTGHLPHWLATNHFMDEGLWLWVIPLRGKTSIGLVYDHNVVSLNEVNSSEKLTKWITERFPLFENELEHREVFDFGAYKDFAYGSQESISGDRWATSGESARFNDPLYSPGSDFISLHNTMIVDAIQFSTSQDFKDDPSRRRLLKRKCWLYELVMQSYYRSLIPSYATSYNALGDAETFSLKYTWELSVYFSFFVFPFINDLHTDSKFLPNLLSRFSKLGPLNHGVQHFLRDYFEWKKKHVELPTNPTFHDFTKLAPLQRAEQTFYEVDPTTEQAKAILGDQLANLEELARFVVTYVSSVVVEDVSLLTNAEFIQNIDFDKLKFCPDSIELAAKGSNSADQHSWSFDPNAMKAFRVDPKTLKDFVVTS